MILGIIRVDIPSHIKKFIVFYVLYGFANDGQKLVNGFALKRGIQMKNILDG
jgi:hypothetical protein